VARRRRLRRYPAELLAGQAHKAGRPQARIAVGKPDGPSFAATGSVIKDPKVEALMLETFAKKYPARWPTHAASFRDGFKDGSRVVVKYVPEA
jgi:hypothetical protein